MQQRRLAMTAAVILSLGVIVAIVVLTWAYLRGQPLPVLNPQGTVALAERRLIIIAALLSLIVVVPTFVALFLFAWRYRDGRGAKYSPTMRGHRLGGNLMMYVNLIWAWGEARSGSWPT